jgi:hypothetical protein
MSQRATLSSEEDKRFKPAHFDLIFLLHGDHEQNLLYVDRTNGRRRLAVNHIELLSALSRSQQFRAKTDGDIRRTCNLDQCVTEARFRPVSFCARLLMIGAPAGISQVSWTEMPRITRSLWAI